VKKLRKRSEEKLTLPYKNERVERLSQNSRKKTLLNRFLLFNRVTS
jgi:hypothetical protein